MAGRQVGGEDKVKGGSPTVREGADSEEPHRDALPHGRASALIYRPLEAASALAAGVRVRVAVVWPGGLHRAQAPVDGGRRATRLPGVEVADECSKGRLGSQHATDDRRGPFFFFR